MKPGRHRGPLRRFAVAATVGLTALTAATMTRAALPERALAAGRANVVLIQADDMDAGLLRARIRSRGRPVPAMPKLLSRVGGQGVEFSRYYSSNPICGPSRASLLSGRSTHNHGMLINAGPFGYPVWRDSDLEDHNLATWLQRAGYRTIHVGKYFNGYGDQEPIPPGWSRWLTSTTNTGATYYGSRINVDGDLIGPRGAWSERDPADCGVGLPWFAGTCQHSTDIQTAFALDEIRDAAGSPEPFFLQLDFNAPHDDGRGGPGPEPPSRYRGLVNRVVTDLDLNDSRGNPSKPDFIRDLPRLTAPLKQEIRGRYAKEVVSMRAVDDAIGRVIRVLRVTGQLDDTYVIFLSDNGMFHGEHLIAYGKFLPHEPATRQPLLMRGPGLPKGAVTEALSSNLDIASTVLRMTGAAPDRPQDGRSLLRYARHPRLRSSSPVLLEGFNGRDLDDPGPFTDGLGRNDPNQALVLNYTGFVADRWKYVRYYYGAEELYDLKRDPREHRNLAADPARNRVMRWARRVSTGLAECDAAACRPELSPPRLRATG